jgi:hypothetical protein
MDGNWPNDEKDDYVPRFPKNIRGVSQKQFDSREINYAKTLLNPPREKGLLRVKAFVIVKDLSLLDCVLFIKLIVVCIRISATI